MIPDLTLAPGLGSNSSWLLPDGVRAIRVPTDVWMSMEYYGERLLTCTSTHLQYRLFLEVALAALAADDVVLYSKIDSFQTLGTRRLSEGWCRDLVVELLQQSPGTESQLLRNDFRSSRTSAVEMPTSVAMIRLSRSRDTWAVVLSFNPERRFLPTDMNMLLMARHLLRTQQNNQRTQERLKETVYALILALASAADARDRLAAGHSKRVAQIAARLGQESGLAPMVVCDLNLAGLLHGIGQIGWNEEKPCDLGRSATDDKINQRERAIQGARLVEGMAQLSHLAPAVRHHRECWDGSGYPDGLAGDRIPLAARIVSVANAFDAMLSGRTDRPALTSVQTELALVAGSGLKWDPNVIRTLMGCRNDLYDLRSKEIAHENP